MFLLNHYTGGETDEAVLIAAGRTVFGCDVAKCCHHGSADFTETFLKAVLPVATVISSGDEDPAHPRTTARHLVSYEAPCITQQLSEAAVRNARVIPLLASSCAQTFEPEKGRGLFPSCAQR